MLSASISKVDDPETGCVLVIRALDRTGRIWRKHYDGVVFLAMDAESLGLLESGNSGPDEKPQLRLRNKASVSAEALQRLRFTQG